ncbi:MAG: DNA repair protein RecO [Pseudomonadota bacterium]
MIQWQDQGIVLTARPHGEAAAVVQLMTRDHGRHAGLVRGGQGRRQRGVLQAGNRVAVTWQARLADHLGAYTVELETSYAARVLDDPSRLAALLAATAVLERALPERESHPACFEGLLALLEGLPGDHWAETYVVWELALLKELGYGLDLERCAAGGANDQLAYVSPRSGRAVSLAAGEPYRERLLGLPGFLIGQGDGGTEEVAQGLRLTGFFLERFVFGPQDRPLPSPRQRLAARLEAPS